jgi:hypothetical protein
MSSYACMYDLRIVQDFAIFAKIPLFYYLDFPSQSLVKSSFWWHVHFIICVHLWTVEIKRSQVWLNKRMERKKWRFRYRVRDTESWECSCRPHQAVVHAKTIWDGCCWYVKIWDLFQSGLCLCFISLLDLLFVKVSCLFDPVLITLVVT